MNAVIRRAHQFVNQQSEAVEAVPDRFESVADALNSFSECCAQQAHDMLSREVEPSVAAQNIRASVDLDTGKPGLWINEANIICTIDMTADSPQKRPKKRRFSPANEDKRANLKIAKLQQDLASAEEKEKQPKKPRKKREKKDTETLPDTDAPTNNDAGSEDALEAESVVTPTTDAVPTTTIPLQNESTIPQAIKHCDHVQIRKAFDRLRRVERSDVVQQDASLDIKHIPQTDLLAPSLTSKHRFFANPTSYVRMYDSLEFVQLHPMLRNPLLRCQPSEGIVATDGVSLLQTSSYELATEKAVEQLRNLLALPTNGPKALRRVLLCASTNATVDAAWAVFNHDKVKKPKILALRTTKNGRAAKEHRFDKSLQSYRGKLVVFSTTAGRNTLQLRDLEFDAIVLLDAQSIPEYETWALLRGSTRHLDLLSCDIGTAGIVEQPQNRSMFRRLADADYPVQKSQ
jgi:hypothetical protein